MTTALRKRIDFLPYSLHDCCITGFEALGNRLRLLFDDGFVRAANAEQVGGWVEFQGVDWVFSFAYVLDFCGNEGRFTGEKLSLADFIARFSDMRLEVIDESYGYCHSKLDGWLWQDGPRECTLEICHLGDMSYIEQSEPHSPPLSPTDC